MLKTSDNEKTLEAARGKAHSVCRGIKVKTRQMPRQKPGKREGHVDAFVRTERKKKLSAFYSIPSKRVFRKMKAK